MVWLPYQPPIRPLRWPRVLLCVIATCGVHVATEAGPMDEVLRSVCVVHTSEGLGTGFVVGEPSLIATNFHVIDGADSAFVQFQDGTRIDVEGFLIASPGYDLAILRLVSDAPGSPLTLIDGEFDIGVDVFAVGNPKGLAGSVSKGVISGRRKWTDMKPLLGGAIHDFGYELDSTWVQTDAAINSGNSGGPLCLADGTVVAINTWSTTPRGGQNLNFAIDSAHLSGFLNRLPEKALALRDLPPAVAHQTGKHEQDADIGRTRMYWSAIAATLGNFAVEQQKLRIEMGLFKPASEKPPTPQELRQRVREKAQQDKETIRKRATAAALLAGGSQNLNSGNRGAINMQVLAKERAEAAKSEVKTAVNRLRRLAAAATRAAERLDALPVEGVHPSVLAFVADLATAHRSLAADCVELARATDMAAAGAGLERLQEAVNLMAASVADLERLRDVKGGELRTRLRNSLHEEFDAVVALTPEELRLFDGTAIEP